eukprot:scaffold87915_cov13-Prasinocladus_malaysianus.AAC.1
MPGNVEPDPFQKLVNKNEEKVGKHYIQCWVCDIVNGKRHHSDKVSCPQSDAVQEERIRMQAIVELNRLRATHPTRNRASFETPLDPLEGWKEHAHLYPLLSEIARIVFSVPGSQI